MIKLESKDDIQKFFSNKYRSNNLPHIIVIALFDNDNENLGQAVDFKNKKEQIICGNYKYKLDSMVARDLSKRHFCCGVTINKKQYLFDGAVFSKLTKRDWKKLLNKNQNWKPDQSTLKWNLMKGYSLLFFYRS